MTEFSAEFIRSENFSSLLSEVAAFKKAIDDHPLVVVPETPLRTVILQMRHRTKQGAVSSQFSEQAIPSAHRVSYALVMADQQLLGIFTERDVVRLSAQDIDFASVTIADVMTQQLITLKVSEFKNVFTALSIFRQYDIRYLPILDDHSDLVGVITAKGLRELLQPTTLLKMHSVSEVMSTNMITVLPSTSMLEVADLMTTHQVSCVVIVKSEDQDSTSVLHPIGIISEWNILEFQTLEANSNSNSVTVESVILSPLVCLSPEDSLLKAYQTMQQLHEKRMVVTDAQKGLAGILTKTNLLTVLNSSKIYNTANPLQQQVDHNPILTPNSEHQTQADAVAMQTRQKRFLTSEQLFRLVFEKAAIGMALIDPDGRWLRVNQAICNIVGYSKAELLKVAYQTITHPDDLELDLIYVQQVLAGEIDTFQLEKRYVHKQGDVVWILLSVSLVRDEHEQPLYFISQVQDITKRKHLEQVLSQEKELAQVTLQSIGDAVITTDVRGNITKFNPIAEYLTGWPTKEAQGQPLQNVFNIIHEETRELAPNPVQSALSEGQAVCLASHTVLISRGGDEYAIEDSAAPIHNQLGQVIGAVMVFHDVTQSRNLSHQLSWQASHDPLTHLVNRRKFDQVLNDALHEPHSDNPQYVLCFLDLDQFKVINDTCGHAAGDELLCQVSKLLQKPIRAADTLARLGGDEFGILLHQCPLDRATIIAEQLRRIIQDFRFSWADKIFGIGISIGLVQLDSESFNIENVLEAADAACYMAKARGRNRIQVYKANDSVLIHQRGEQRWSIRIKRAIEEDRFCLFAQAIVPTAETTTHKSKSEILLRMIGEQGDVISASKFISSAEHYNLITDIDRWVISKFLRDNLTKMQTSEEKVGSSPQFMINLSGGSVGDEQFLQFLKTQLKKHPNSAKQICFEITETAAISNLGQAVEFIQEIKQLGCQFALDDFGTGMSSFAYLKTLPVDYLKIDGHFIKDIVDDPTTSAIVESINHIGHVMGMQTIAEYVSSESIREKLQKIGVDYIQGYSISKPYALKL